MTLDWRTTQRQMFGGAELEQDARIKEYFRDCSKENTLLYGDTHYFEDFFPNNIKPYYNSLIILNSEIEIGEMTAVLRGLNSELYAAKKICVAVNKFCVYSEHANTNVNADYDTALIGLITSCLARFKTHTMVFDKDLKGDRFNFASPYTQVYLEKHADT